MLENTVWSMSLFYYLVDFLYFYLYNSLNSKTGKAMKNTPIVEKLTSTYKNNNVSLRCIQDAQHLLLFLKSLSPNNRSREYASWSKIVHLEILRYLKKYGFKRINTEDNKKNPDIVFMGEVHSAFTKLYFSPLLPPQRFSGKDSSAFALNTAFIKELESFFSGIFK